MALSASSPPPHSHRRLVIRLLLGVAAAFAFGFALVPLYDTLCRITGLNGKNFIVGGLVDEARAPATVDRSRLVTVEFTGTVMPGLPWDMRPLQTRVELHPGELQQARFLVRNTSSQPITGQAIPSVSPGQAASHFEKLDCFCFAQQTLAPGEARELPLVFIVRPELEREVRTITLSYAFYNVTPEPGGKRR